MDEKLHILDPAPTAQQAPEEFPWPFVAQPHPLARAAATQVMRHVDADPQLSATLAQGKMLGVLVVKPCEDSQQAAFLAAFSGNLCEHTNEHPYFVPPVYNLLDPGGEFKQGEAEINRINQEIKHLESEALLPHAALEAQEARLRYAQEIERLRHQQIEAKNRRDALRAEGYDNSLLIQESQFQKAEFRRIKQRLRAEVEEKEQHLNHLKAEINRLKEARKNKSNALQRRIFQLFRVHNALGESANLLDVFHQYYAQNPTLTASSIPPAGAGECCAPKLLQYAYLKGYTPVCLSEFWYGAPPTSEVRHHGYFYGACMGKCRPILGYMMQGLNMAANPLQHPASQEIAVIYEDEWMVVANKPAGMLSVPGRLCDNSLLTALSERLGASLYIVHRLDMDTSGVMIYAKTTEVQATLQAAFSKRQVRKWYIAILEGTVAKQRGEINLPLAPNFFDRPRQVVDENRGKQATTRYYVISHHNNRTHIAFYPLTGRTHQLRVHASHQQGLGCPIVGDALYGNSGKRLMLHALRLTLPHPVTGKRLRLNAPCACEECAK